MSDPTPDTTAPEMTAKDWRTLRKILQENVDRYENKPQLQGVRDGLKGALAYMDGCEQYRSMGVPSAGSGTANPDQVLVEREVLAEVDAERDRQWEEIQLLRAQVAALEAGAGTAALTDTPKHGDIRSPRGGDDQVYLDGRSTDGEPIAPAGWYEIGPLCAGDGGE